MNEKKNVMQKVGQFFLFALEFSNKIARKEKLRDS